MSQHLPMGEAPRVGAHHVKGKTWPSGPKAPAGPAANRCPTLKPRGSGDRVVGSVAAMDGTRSDGPRPDPAPSLIAQSRAKTLLPSTSPDTR